MDMEAMKRELQQSGALKAAAGSREAQRVLRGLDAAGLERAAKQGDAAALRGYLEQILSTPEGKNLAEQVRKAVSKNG